MTDQNESIQTDIDLKQLEEKQRIEQAYQKMTEEQKSKTIQLYHNLIRGAIVVLLCFLGLYLYQSFESYFTAKNNTAKDKTEQEKLNLGKEIIYELREVRVNQLPDLSNDDRFQKKDGIPVFHKNALKKLNPNQNSKPKNTQELERERARGRGREDEYEEESQE